MEMIHQSLSYPYCSNYGNYNPHNEKPSYNNNTYENRVYNRTKPIETRYQFSSLVNKNNNKSEVNQNQDLDKNNEVIEFKTGMQDVPTWLKSLRLHKYKLIFSELTYEEMLLLTEKQLEEKNVTKGARHKIIVNIDKLRARQSNVINMEKSVEQEGVSGIRQSLNELKNMLLTPIKSFEPENENKNTKNSTEIQEGDIPSQIMRLLEKIFSCIQSEMIRDDEIINLYLVNCEKCLSHDAFTAFHKQRLIKIKSKLEQIKLSNQQLHSKNLENKTNKLKWNNSTMPLIHLQNANQFKNVTKNINNFQNSNNFNNQLVNSNQVISQHYHHHPYQNSNKFLNSNYSSINSQQSLYTKNQNKSNSTHNNLVSSNQLNNNFNINIQNKQNNYNMKLNDNNLYNIGVDIYKNIETNNGIENNRKTDNKTMLNENLTKFSDVFNFEKQSNQVNNEKLNKIIAPLTSCSFFNACSQIGKLTQVNDENYNNSNQFNYDKTSNYGHLESNLIKQQNNQFVFGNLIQNDNYLANSNILKCLDKKNSNILTNQKFNYETDDFDEKLDENHQIYNHIELLSLRMTEQALGSSDFS